MPKRAAGLTAKGVETITKPGFFADGNNLYLKVSPEGARSWVFRYSVAGKRRDMGLGSTSLVGLAEARRKALDLRRVVTLEHRDPLAERMAGRATAAKALTFEQCADSYILSHKAGWSVEHRKNSEGSLRNDVYPTIGSLPVSAVGVGEVMRVLEPIWLAKPGIAGRVRQRIESVLDFATAHGHRAGGENPARWRGHLENLLPRPTKVRAVEHHAALPYDRIAGFLVELRAQSGTASRALEFAILTAARTGEVRGATWAEIDLQAAAWCIPGSRMKTGREHKVPLSDAALAVLRALPRGKDTDIVFPGINGAPIGERAIARVLERLGRAGDCTPHGFRSTFRDWCAERTNFPHEVAEMALAHAVGNKVEAAYRRGDLFDKRRQLADAWAAFCEAAPVESGGKVVAIRG